MRKASSSLLAMSLFSRTMLFTATLALLLVVSAAPALAQDNPARTTTAQQTVSNNRPDQPANVRPPIFVTFTPINKGIGASPNATFGCSIPYPTATITFATGTVTWSGSISCTIAVGLYGTTVLYHYPNGPNVAYGNQINTNSASASSSGAYSGVPSGTYEVNFNVDITPPAGYTTSVGGGCSYINGGPSVHCTVGSGTFTQP